MRKFRRLLALALLLVLPLQGYAVTRMAVLGSQGAAPEMAAQAEAGMPCHMEEATPATDGMHHDASAPADDHGCVKCPLCALHAGLPLPRGFGLASAPPHAEPTSALLAPAAVYLDLPLPVPRGIAA